MGMLVLFIFRYSFYGSYIYYCLYISFIPGTRVKHRSRVIPADWRRGGQMCHSATQQAEQEAKFLVLK